jgi:hypothetical protein
MKKPTDLQHPAPPRPRPSRIIPAVIPLAAPPRGGPEAINSTAPAAIRAASAALVQGRRPAGRLRRQPVTDDSSKAAAQAPAWSALAPREFLEYEQGGGI